MLEPDQREREVFEERRSQLLEMEEEILVLAGLESVTRDGQPVALRANMDLPQEAEEAARHGAEGVGLYRTEFLVVGRAVMPGEEEQYAAYRQVAEGFPEGTIFVRTFDLGGDKFPMFLHMPAEENPFLGWRAIRVCLDQPELFRTQLRAILRSTAHGDVRIMLPLVTDASEIKRTRRHVGRRGRRAREGRHPVQLGLQAGHHDRDACRCAGGGRASSALGFLLDRDE